MRTRLKKQTARSFAYEWQQFRAPAEELEDNFRGYFQFFPAEFFRGKRVLEAGSGMGRHTYFLSHLAEEVVAIDLGESIRVTASNVKGRHNVRLVQADIDELPFPPQSFDFICSIGVLHHLPDPAAGFRRLAACLRPGGTLHVYLYWALEDAPRWKRALLAGVTSLRKMTVKLPYPLLKGVAWFTAAAGFLGFSLPYRYLSPWQSTSRWVKNLPFQRYARDGFRICYNDQFDRWSAPIEHRFNRQQVVHLFDSAELVDIQVQEHYGWLACGRRPEKAAG